MKKEVRPDNCKYADSNRRLFINFDMDSANYMIDLVRNSENNYTIFIVISSRASKKCEHTNIYNSILSSILHMYYYINNNFTNRKIKIVICPMMNKIGYAIIDALKFNSIPIKVQGSRNLSVLMDNDHNMYYRLERIGDKAVNIYIN